MRILALLALTAVPASAEGRHDTILNCTFGSESISVIQNGGGYRLEVGGQSYTAGLAQPGADGRVVGVFAMLEGGPIMIAVATTTGEKVHAANVTAAAKTAGGLATRSTEGTCREGAP
jgi:hypothetical protein